MTVAFRNLGGAEIAGLGSLLQLVAAQPFRHQADQRFGRGAKFGGIRLFDADQIARGLDHCHLHPEADTEIGHVALARELRRANFALRAALAEAAGHQDAIDVFQERSGILVLEYLALDPVEIDLHLVGDTAMRQRLDQRFVGILHAGVFADNRDRHRAFRISYPLVDNVPALQRGRHLGLDAECRQYLVVETGGVIGLRHGVDVVDVARLDYGAFAHIAEQAELASLFLRNRPVGAAQEDIRLDANRAQLLDRMLGRFGLEFAGARNERQQRQMNVDGMVARQVALDLADRLEERQALDVANGAADLAQHEVEIFIAVEDEILDRIGDVRDHLDGGAEIIAAPLLGQDILIDAAGGDVVGFRGGTSGKALIVTEVEIGLGAIISHEHFAMLVWRHRSGVEIEIRIEFAPPNPVTARLQQPESR